MIEPKWLDLPFLLAMHVELIRRSGGSDGVRDQGLLESALARPKNLYAYGEEAMSVLAAALATGVIKNHPFIDGNKRSGFLASVVFLETNGYAFKASQADAAVLTIGLAASEISEVAFGRWLSDNVLATSTAI